MSNVRTLQLATEKVVIGEYSVDLDKQLKAEKLVAEAYPEITIISTALGKKQIPLQELLLIHGRYTRERDATYRLGYDDGRESGYNDGLKDGQREAREVVASLSHLVADVTGQRAAILADAKDKILDMVLKISQKLTFSAATLDPEVTMAIISGAIEQLLDKSRIKIKVHPDHLAIVEQNIDRFRGSDTSIKEFTFEADPRVRIGGCFIETPSGDIDARLESMFDIIRQSLLGIEDKES